VPVSVLSNWRTQISDHVTSETLSYHVYYESGRNVTPRELTSYNIIVTTYQTVVQDFAAKEGAYTQRDNEGKVKKKQKANGGLFDITWKVSKALSDGILD